MAEEKKADSEYITSFPDEILLDRAYGVCIGAAIGDSIGSFCEFRKTEIDKQELDEAMTMPGGGTWRKKVITGQVTDDTELAVSCAYGLIDIIGKSSSMTRLKSNDNDNNDTDDQKKKDQYSRFDLTKIAKEYRRWIDSSPFDIGFCTRATLSLSPDVAKMKQKAFDYNAQKTKSNNKLSSSIFKGQHTFSL